MVATRATEIQLPAEIAYGLLEHARAELPNEACGLLGGDLASTTVTAFHTARNEHASPYRFSIDRRDLVRITYALEGAGQDLVAIFHSHPNGPARPSATDLREARYPMALHVLAGLGASATRDSAPASLLRAWRIANGICTEVSLRIG
jgi:proteasome lid subunit RPN8/RPN11